MTRKYATFNPAAGEYVVVNTLEEATKKAAEFALAFYFLHTHDTPCTVIDVAEDGSETWTSLSGEAVLSPEQVSAELEAQMSASGRFTVSASIPVSHLGD